MVDLGKIERMQIIMDRVSWKKVFGCQVLPSGICMETMEMKGEEGEQVPSKCHLR